MKSGMTAVLVFGLLTVLVFPFARDAYTRHQVLSRLRPVMTEQDRLAFRSWNGDASSFARSLLNRCRLDNGSDSAACQPYRIAASE